MKSHWVAIVLGVTLIAVVTVAAPAASQRRAAAGSLDFKAVLFLTSTSVACPADVPPNTTECGALTTVGSAIPDSVRQLGGFAWATYTLPLGIGPPTCTAGLGKPLVTTGRLIVGGQDFAEMGEIGFALSEGARCVGYELAQDEPQAFTITGGTGRFAGASGRGTLVRGWDNVLRTETWTGTLTGIHLTGPKLTGAVAKTVRATKGAKSARVTFEVTATDYNGFDIPVLCRPGSGSRFPLGKTTVRCTTTDASGNTATARFTVTVKRRQ